MAKQTTRTMAKKRNEDPAALAWKSVRRAGNDDAAYLAAIEQFEGADPTTRRGLELKQALLQSRLAGLNRGDRLTSAGRAMMSALEKSVNEGIVRLT